MQIIPSILVQSAEEFLRQNAAIADTVNHFQLDIADGQFVANTTWAEPDVIKKNVRGTCELHLMVQEPLAVIRAWSDVPQITRVLFPAECGGDISEIIKAIHHAGWQASLVLNPETQATIIEPFIAELDGVMCMGVHPGWQHQSFIPEVLPKITALKAAHPNLFIELDGGVNRDTLPEIFKTNLDAVCPGSAIFGNENSPAENIQKMQKLINELTKVR